MNMPEPQALLAVPVELGEQREITTHAHMANEFLLCLCGKGIHESALGRIPFARGTLCFFPRGHYHAHHAISAKCSLISVRMRDEALVRSSQIDQDAIARLAYFKRRAYLGENPLEMDGSSATLIGAMFRKAVEENTLRKSGYENMLKGYALQTLVILSRVANYDSSAPALSEAEGLLQVLAVVDQNPGGEFSVAQMAELAHMSRSHFHARFRELTGSTLVEHLTRLRVGLASRMLGNTEQSVIDIGYACGFASVSRFYEAFKKITGKPPHAWRKMNVRQRQG